MQTHAFLFALMTVQPLAAWWWFPLVKCYEKSLRTHGQFTNFLHYRDGFTRSRAALPNEFFPSNFFPSCHPGSIHVWLLCKQLSC